jgi:hypothetical protein
MVGAMNQRTGMFATMAIIAAIVSYFLTFSGHTVWGIILALVSIPLGIGGFIMAASPRVSGGIISIISILIGVFAIGVAVIAMIF